MGSRKKRERREVMPGAIDWQNVTVRLDPKTRFMLEFVARTTGRSLTTVIEHGIQALASEGVEIPDGGRHTWREYWHPSDGVRQLRLLLAPPSETTYADELLAEFVRAHLAFFADDPDSTEFLSPDVSPLAPDRIDVLWPRIREFLATWEATRASDRYAAGRAMVECLQSAGLKSPNWPPDKALRRLRKPAE